MSSFHHSLANSPIILYLDLPAITEFGFLQVDSIIDKISPIDCCSIFFHIVIFDHFFNDFITEHFIPDLFLFFQKV